MPIYCTIIFGGYGSPHRHYSTAPQALRAAQRLSKRTGETVEVAWCKYHGNPKVWLATVGPQGTTYQRNWKEVVDGDRVDATMRAAGYEQQSTGGGCWVWQRDCGDGTAIWISNHDSLYGDPDAEQWLVGRYSTTADSGSVDCDNGLTLASALVTAPMIPSPVTHCTDDNVHLTYAQIVAHHLVGSAIA